MANKSSPLDEIKKHQDAIAALKNDAVNALKAEKAALETQVRALANQIASITGRSVEKAPRRKRSPSVSVSIEQIVKEIKGGKTNNNQIAKALGCSPAKVKVVVANDGKAAGISSTGQRSKFAYSLKK
jgi:DNA-binding NarL/FixJ family response regulator